MVFRKSKLEKLPAAATTSAWYPPAASRFWVVSHGLLVSVLGYFDILGDRLNLRYRHFIRAHCAVNLTGLWVL